LTRLVFIAKKKWASRNGGEVVGGFAALNLSKGQFSTVGF
jgi:hypothetical protein